MNTSPLRVQMLGGFSIRRKEKTLRISDRSRKLCLLLAFLIWERKRPVPWEELAGLLHDCAKCIPNGKKLKLCEKHNIQISETERRNPFLLHAKLGAFLAMDRYGVEDKEIISAILNHTTGKPNMSLLDKIVYVADYIEPRRSKAENLEEIRKLAFLDLDQALYQILSDTLKYLDKGSGEIDNMTMKAYEYYHKKQQEPEQEENNDFKAV